MIVVLVRKLLVALWKYVNSGLVIEGGGPQNRRMTPETRFQSPGSDQP